MKRCSLLVMTAVMALAMSAGGCKKSKDKPKKSPAVEEKSAEAMKASRVARKTPRKTDDGKATRASNAAGSASGENAASLVGSKVLVVFASVAHKLHHPSCQGKVLSVGRVGMMMDRTTTFNIKKKEWVPSLAKMFLPWSNIREVKIMGK